MKVTDVTARPFVLRLIGVSCAITLVLDMLALGSAGTDDDGQRATSTLQPGHESALDGQLADRPDIVTPERTDPADVDPSSAAPPGSGVATEADGPAEPSSTVTTGGRDAPITVGRGINDREILIGIPWEDPTKTTTMTESIGAGGAGADREGGKAIPQAVIDYINESGGVAGRKIVPAFHEVDITQGVTKSGRAREAQARCARWTEDAKVFAFVGAYGWSDELIRCAVKTQTPYIVGTSQPADEQWAAETPPYFFAPNGFTIERFERTSVERMAAQGFFDADAKVGIMIDGSEASFKKAADRALRPALAQLDVEVVHEIIYPDWVDSPWSNYVLQLQSAGVTHLLWGNGLSGLPIILFMRAADQQRYIPRYGGLGSDRTLADMASLAPPAHLRNVTAFGWVPNIDLSGDEGPITPRDKECRDLLADAGFPDQSSKVSHGFCDTLFFIRDALDVAPSLTPEGMATAVDSFGTSWVPALSWSTRFSPGRYDGADAVRNIAYDPECECFQYTSAPVKAQ